MAPFKDQIKSIEYTEETASEISKSSNTHLLDVSNSDQLIGNDYGINRTWKSAVWETLDYPPEHRVVLNKVDVSVLLFAMLSTFIKYLDKSNLPSAYVSGMQEDLGIKGNELSYANSGYSIGSIISGFLSGFLMVHYNTRWFTLIIEASWILTTFCFVLIKTPTQMVVLRTVVGITEGGHFASLMFMCGSYYTKQELARRTNLINAFTAVGPMIAYFIQSQASAHLSGTNGYKGWQWTFLLDGIISLFVLIFQFCFYPDILERMKPTWFFKDEDLSFLRRRLEIERSEISSEEYDKSTKLTLKDLKRFLFTWQVYPFWLYAVLGNFSQEPAAAVPFYFKGWNKIKPGSYTTPQITYLTIPTYAIQLVVSCSCGWLSDVLFKGQRWQVLSLGILWTAIINFVLATHKIFESNRAFILFFLYNTSVGQAVAGLYWAQVQDVFKHDTKLRSFATGGINPASGVCSAIIGPLLYPSSMLPEIYTGFYASGAISLVYSIVVIIFGLYIRHITKHKLSLRKYIIRNI